MNSRYIVVRFGGHWDGLDYKNGEEEVIRVKPGKIHYNDLLDEINGVVEADKTIYDYVMYSFVDIAENKIGKLKLKNDRDIDCAFANTDLPVVFVTIKRKNTETIPHDVVDSKFGYNQVANEQGAVGGFMQLMASQNILCSQMFPAGPSNNIQYSIPVMQDQLGFQPYCIPSVHTPNVDQPGLNSHTFTEQHRERCSEPNIDQPKEGVVPNAIEDCYPNFGCDWSENRAQSVVESSNNPSRKGQVCSRCGAAGHNCVKCSMSIPLEDDSASVTQPGTSRKTRSKNKCGICRATDHTRRKCPKRPNDKN